MVVVGVAGFPVGNDDGFWAKLANHGGETELVLARWLDIGIRNSQSAAPFDGEELGSFGGFFGASLRGATGTHFAGGEIKDAGFVATLRHFEECAATGEFDIVGVRGYG